MNLTERKIIGIFKSFIEKVFVPQLSKMDLSSQQEWNKFSTMISPDQFNIGQVQIYVDGLTGFGSNFNRPNTDINENRQNFFLKSKKQPSMQFNTNTFNPSKTFGGEKARAMFPLKDYE